MGNQFWVCEACLTQNHVSDGECQYCECQGERCRRDNCSGNHEPMTLAQEHDALVHADGSECPDGCGGE